MSLLRTAQGIPVNRWTPKRESAAPDEPALTTKAKCAPCARCAKNER